MFGGVKWILLYYLIFDKQKSLLSLLLKIQNVEYRMICFSHHIKYYTSNICYIKFAFL